MVGCLVVVKGVVLMGRVGGAVGWHFLRFVNLVPRDLEFSSYDVRYFSNVKSRLLGLLFCFGLLDRVGRFRRGFVYRPGLLFSFVPCNDLGWVFALSHAAVNDYLALFLKCVEEGRKLPKPVLGYLLGDVRRFLRYFAVVDGNGRLTFFGRVLGRVRDIFFSCARSGGVGRGVVEDRFGRVAVFLLQNLLFVEPVLSYEFTKLYVAALIAASKYGDELAVDVRGTISVRFERVLEVFSEFFGGSSEELMGLIRGLGGYVYLEADKDPRRRGFVVVSLPDFEVRGVRVEFP